MNKAFKFLTYSLPIIWFFLTISYALKGQFTEAFMAGLLLSYSAEEAIKHAQTN